MSSTTPPDAIPPSQERKPFRRRRAVFALAVGLTAAIGLGWTFVAKAANLRVYLIPSLSMAPTLLSGDKVCVDKQPWQVPKRGELWLFSMPSTAGTVAGVAVKRVIGLPGETVEVKGGKVWINGTALDEPYLAAPPNYMVARRTLGDSEYFMLGDNRNLAVDSHIWGPIPFDRFIGRALYRVWPLRRAGGL